MSSPTTVAFEPREDFGMRYEEFDLEMNRMGFVGHRLMPIISRANKTGKFPRVEIGQMLQNLDTKRAADGSYPRSIREFSDDNYETQEYGLEAILDDRVMARYDDLIDAEAFEGAVIENSLLTAYEQAVAGYLFNATTFAGRTGAPTSGSWAVWNTADPNADINEAISTVRKACGVKPNAVVMSDETFREVINCEKVIDRLKYQGFQDARPGNVAASALAVSLNIDEVIVADCLYNKLQPQTGTPTTHDLDDIWNKNMCLVARIARTNSPAERCIGRTIMWAREGAMAGDRMAVIAESYYEDYRRGGTIRRRTDWTLKDLQLECGYLLEGVNP